jgi:hypothetical protein
MVSVVNITAIIIVSINGTRISRRSMRMYHSGSLALGMEVPR